MSREYVSDVWQIAVRWVGWDDMPDVGKGVMRTGRIAVVESWRETAVEMPGELWGCRRRFYDARDTLKVQGRKV